MSTAHAFTLLRQRELPELSSEARWYRHDGTGAQLVSVVNGEDNKVFGITFRTPPKNSTGVAHILEHSVLCGSRKYPVKEPFVQLMKGSLNTFLNAMTYPDKTCYPVASQNTQDFYNLIDVYLDAVLHPRLAPHTLAQEGWHYELAAPDAPLTYNGVVFNEMKGNYSSADEVLSTGSQRSLFPDSVYGHDSGGDPRHIPDLTYQEFKAFHSQLYHPSNARVFFYGNDPAAERLRLLDGWLNEFAAQTVDSRVGLQPRFGSPKRLQESFMAGAGSSSRSAMLTVNWMLGELADVSTQIALALLEEILIGTPASPLRKALLESGLGEDIAGDGLQDELRQPMFSVGLKGIDPDDAERVEALIMATLQALAVDGIDAATIEAAVNSIEFRLRENNFGAFPRGIVLMLRCLKLWLHDHDPLAALAFEPPLTSIKAQIAQGGYFEHVLGREFLHNSHRTTLLLVPDPRQADREAAQEAERLAAVRARMSSHDLLALTELTRTHKQLQETPDSPEALASIPSLQLSDLPRQSRTIPIEASSVGQTRVLYHDLAANGVLYLDVGFNLRALDPELLPLAALFGRALLETGAGELDFVGLAQRIGSKTGGIRPRLWCSALTGSAAGTGWLFLRAKTMADQSAALIELLGAILGGARLDNRPRISQLVLEEKAAEQSRLLPAGASLVNVRLRSHLHEADWVSEQTGGISYLLSLRELADRLDSHWNVLEGKLQRIRDALFRRENMVCNVTAEPDAWRRLQPQLAGLLELIPARAAATSGWTVREPNTCEALTLPTKVKLVAKGSKLLDLGYTPTGATQVVTKFLNTSWLWEKVRVQGGAYGGFCGLDPRSGVFTFTSYRDPNLLDTLKIFDGTCKFLSEVEIGQADVARSIIGTIGEIDRYQLPEAQGFTSMTRYLANESDASIQQLRAEVLAATVREFREFAGVLTELARRGRVVVMASPEVVQVANAQAGGFLHPLPIL